MDKLRKLPSAFDNKLNFNKDKNKNQENKKDVKIKNINVSDEISFEYINNLKLGRNKNELILKKINHNSEIWCSKFSHNDNIVSFGCADGKLIVDNILNNKHTFVELNRNIPITCIKNSKNLSFLACNSNGELYNINYNTLENNLIYRDINNSFLSMDVNYENNIILLGGTDNKIKLWDSNTNKIIKIYDEGDKFNKGHTNRIFSIKTFPNNQNIFVTGGWDKNLYFWDIRTKTPIDHIFGFPISGESLDFKNNDLLIGTQSLKDNLQIYDFNKREFKEKLEFLWTKNNLQNYIYCCEFYQNEDIIFAGVSGLNNITGLKYHNEKYEEVFRMTGFKSNIFTIDIAKSNKTLITGTGSGEIIILKF